MWRRVEALAGPVGARSSHQVSVVGSRLLLFGGEQVPRVPVDDVVYGLELEGKGPREWKAVPCQGECKPAARVGHAQAVIDKRMYVFGGRQGITMGEAPMNDLFYLDTETVTWKRVDAEAPPSPRSFHQMVSVGEKLFVFGGCGASGRLNDLHCFDTSINEWKALPTGPEDLKPRGGAALAPSPDHESLLVMGGFSGQEMGDVWRFSLVDNTWSRSEHDLPRPRSVTSCALVGKQVVIVGGEVDPSDKGHEGAGGFDSDVTLLDGPILQPRVFQVQAENDETLPPRGWASGSAFGDTKFVIAGGLAGDDNNPIRLSDVWILSLV